MKPRFVNQRVFLWIIHLRHSLLWVYNWYLRRFYGMKLAPDVRISLKARMDKTNPGGIRIDEQTLVAFDSIILSHDFATQRHSGQYEETTHIGARCFIGCGSIIMPGVRIGDECIVAAGSVVTHDVPAHSIVAGNPAKVIRSGIHTLPFGRLIPDENRNKANKTENTEEKKVKPRSLDRQAPEQQPQTPDPAETTP
ncbi:MAG: acyltransferase [Thiothrix sp.]|nr:acyltransferase [Thiothrix sp.]HPE59424.1 acyltransferase [Thiolinea sp.]